MQPSLASIFYGLRAALLTLSALVLLSACGDPKTPDTNTEPCSGACPPEQCVFGMCQVDPNNEVDASEDIDEPDAEPDAEPDVEDEVEDKTCAEDAQCADEEYCNFSGGNDEGVCEDGCREGGCPEGQACDLDSRLCVDEPDCTEDEDCPDGLVCDEGACVGEPCTEEGQCPFGQFCDEELGFCQPGCEEDLNCPNGQTCTDGECVGEACDADDDCPDEQFCNEELGFCQDGCRGDDACLGGEICLEGDCIEGCRQDDNCLPGFYCDEPNNTCLEGCRGDEDCAEGESCVTVVLEEDGERQQCEPTPCTQDVDCLEGFFCEVPDGVDEGDCALGCREGSCQEGEVCDLETRFCVEAPCADSAECPEGQFCDTQFEQPLCVPGCDSDLQCDGQPCNLETNTCGCGQDSDCPDNGICSLGLCIPRCAQDTDCPEGSFCELDTGLCLEGCQDDTLEPNNTIQSALNIAPGQQDLRMCYGAEIGVNDNDCFEVTLAEEDVLSVDIAFAHADGNLDLALYDRNEVPLRVSDSLDDDEDFVYIAEADGEYVFCIEPQGVAFESNYSLSVDIEIAQGCVPDINEANNDNTCEGAQVLDLPIGQVNIIEGRTICEGDRDFVAVELLAGQQLDVRLIRGLEDDELDVRLLGDGCGGVLAQTINFGPERDLVFQAPADGVYALEVFGELAGFEGAYRLEMTRTVGDAQCRDDIIDDLPVEPNESSEGATFLRFERQVEFELDGLFVCAADEDWYQVLIEVPTDIIQVTLSQSANDVPLEVAIVDLDGLTDLDSTSENSPIKTAETLPLEEGGLYFIRVRGGGEPVGAAGVSYSLSVQVTPSSECIPDGFEPNNIAEGAALLSNGAFQATMCRDDANEADFYRFQLGAGDQVNISLEYDHDELLFIDTLPAILYDPDNNIRDFMARSFDDPNVDELVSGQFFVGPADEGDWILEVAAGEAGGSIDYTINVEIISPSCEEEGVEDIFEPNEDCGGAERLFPFVEQPGFVCGPTGDEDFFKVAVDAGQTLSVHMDYFHFDGNLDLEVYEPETNTQVGFSYNSGPDFEDVVIENAVEGDYCIRVFGLSELTQNRYTIEATTE